jgi:hypothetical protein
VGWASDQGSEQRLGGDERYTLIPRSTSLNVERRAVGACRFCSSMMDSCSTQMRLPLSASRSSTVGSNRKSYRLISTRRAASSVAAAPLDDNKSLRLARRGARRPRPELRELEVKS